VTFPRDPNQDGNARQVLDPNGPASPGSSQDALPELQRATTLDPRLPIAQAYIRARFFPPIPADCYAPAALAALDAIAEDDQERLVDLPPFTEPLPRGYTDTDEGYAIPAAALYEILRLDRLQYEWLDAL
jgi:hypothetical protein